jgi:hypothetical protein
MLDVLKYFVVVNGQVKLVQSKQEYEKNTIGLELVDRKIEFIMKTFLTHQSIQRLLFEIVQYSSSNWWSLMKKSNKEEMKKVFYKYLLHLIKKSGSYYHKGGDVLSKGSDVLSKLNETIQQFIPQPQLGPSELLTAVTSAASAASVATISTST